MKQDLQTTSLEYSDVDQEEFLKQLTEELLQYVELRGEQHGKKNRPMTDTELRSLIVNKIEATVQSGLDDNRKRHLMESGIAIQRRILADAQQKAGEIDAVINDNTDKIIRLNAQKKNCTPDLDRIQGRKYTYWGIGVLSAAEGYFSYEALRHGHVPKIPSFVIASGIAVAIGGGSHIAAGWIKKAKNRAQCIFRYCAVLIPVFIGFAALGHIRADAYNNIINLHIHPSQVFSSAGSVSGWQLTALSFFLFVAALAFSLKYYKTEEESMREQRYKQLCADIDELKADNEANEKLKDDILTDANTQAAMALLRLDYAIINENRLETLARQALEAYKDKNLNYRSDVTPVFYSHLPVFNLKFYFKNYKNSRYETNNVPPYHAHVE